MVDQNDTFVEVEHLREVSRLKKERGKIKGKLTSSEKLLAAINEQTNFLELNLDDRLQNHLKLWDEFENIQEALEFDVYEENDLAIALDNERTSFEDRFHRITALLKKYIKNPRFGQSTVPQTHSLSGESDTQVASSESNNGIGRDRNSFNFSSRFELPKLQAPIFYGGVDTWLTFHDTFKSMCHDNSALSPIQKFHYLKACLKDEAAEVIASLEITHNNYEVAWGLLKTRYDNRKFIVNSHVQAIFDIPSMSKEFSVRALLDNVQKRLRALKALEQPIEHWDTLLVFIVRSKLNNYTREKWEESIGSAQLPSFNDMTSFLEKRALIEGSQSIQKPKEFQKNNNQRSSNFNSRNNSRNSQSCMKTTVNSNSEKPKPKCHACQGDHLLEACEQFNNLSPQERYDVVRAASICHNCFLQNHRTIECRRNRCRHCKRRHHDLLHFSESKSFDTTPPQKETQVVNNTTVMSFHTQVQTQVILGTAIVDIRDSNGHYRPCRAFLDSCSQCNSITEKLASSLGLHKKEVNVKLKGVETIQSNIKYSTSTKIKSRYEDVVLDLSLLIFNNISEVMPARSIDRSSLKIPNEIFLADPLFHEPSEVDILIGAEHFYNLLRAGQIKVKDQSAIFQETDLGWIFAGRYVSPSFPKSQSKAKQSISCNLIKFYDLPILWELGEERNSKPRSAEEQLAEQHYVDNTTRDSTGRYSVELPFNDKKDSLGESRNRAFQRFYALEKRFLNNADLKRQYSECMGSYFQEGHLSLIDNCDVAKPGYYLPHQAVIKSDSLTTKTRVVFDASSKTSTGISLNDTLLIGPTIQEDLFSIVIRFRSFPIALTADIQQMYRQIRVSSKDTLYQRILWRENPNDPIRTYLLNTVTFGTACAPFLATRTLHQLAADESQSFPIAAKVLKEDVYVDDFLIGARTFDEAKKLKDDLIKLLKAGGFNLRKWISNCRELCQDAANQSNEFFSLDPSETVKALGIHWDPLTDSILYTVNSFDKNVSVTKRTILSRSATLFDPKGLLGPVILVAKILIQDLWKLKLDWDDPVPLEIQSFWAEYNAQLHFINQIRFPRCVTIKDAKEIQLHGFCDASEKAYGACLYFRSTNYEGNHFCALICSKSRVAPIKTKTLPKLELCAAFLLAQLFKSTMRSLRLSFSKTFFWSDSTIVLNWINSSPHTLPTFVANRVAEIQTVSQISNWRHVRTHENPADFISRGQNPQDFLNNTLWAQGPEWLKQDESRFPNFNFRGQEQLENNASHDASAVSLPITRSEFSLWEQFSKFKKLQLVVAYWFRFIKNARTRNKKLRVKGALSIEEIRAARTVILKKVQSEAFPNELRTLQEKKPLDKKSSLLNLNPFIEDGLIKVGGRLNNSKLPESQRHPIVLPKKHKLTSMIIRDEHLDRSHAGVNATLYGIRETYWPLDGRNQTRHVIRQCVKCFRFNPRETNYLMGDLPKTRVTFARPFLHAGVDYCGPFYVKERRHRNRTKLKTYVAVFVCMATKAIHLELASDLTTEAFLACLKRFFARRGLASSIHSDNGTNFVGASNEIKQLFDQISNHEQSDELKQYLLLKEVSWHFIPPRAPHFGGLWEAGVKSFKKHFIKTAGNCLLTYEQLQTCVMEIEAILNSRPITPLSSDPTDLLPLTPGHFLTGGTMISLPEADLSSVAANRLSSWQLAQQIKQHFWARWHREYLNELMTRSKWQSAANQTRIAPGCLVIVKEDNLPPMVWKLARITEVIPGPDGIIRTAVVRTATTTLKRAVKNLYLLPID